MSAREGSPLSLTHGQVCYLQIPADDVARAAEFYRAVFGWEVEPPGAGFTAPGLIGQWVTDRPSAADAGPLAWIHVQDLDAALAAAAASGGRVLTQPEPDGPVRVLATISDPAGNTVGIVSHGPR